MAPVRLLPSTIANQDLVLIHGGASAAVSEGFPRRRLAAPLEILERHAACSWQVSLRGEMLQIASPLRVNSTNRVTRALRQLYCFKAVITSLMAERRRCAKCSP